MFLDGGGACGDLIATIDWASTPLGPVASWPSSLTATVGNLLHTRQPMLLFWGPELIQLYNDPFVPSFGRGKHPAAMGQRARDCWADAWPVVGAQIEAVMARGEPAWFEDALVPIHRNGRMEDVFWTYSYSPAFDDDGRIRGTLVIVTETTGRVLARRRLESLAQLSVALSAAVSYDAVVAALLALAASWPGDLPLAELRRAARPDPSPPELSVETAVGADHVVVLCMSARLPFDDGYRSYFAQIAEQVGASLIRIDHQRQRDALLLALEQANRSKDEFLAMLGHELRNPLAPIVTALALMNAKDPNASSGAERAIIERQVKHVVRLVDDLLDVSRIARGMLTLDKRPVELARIVAVACEACAPLIQQRRHALTTEIPSGVLVDGDEARLVQVVSNLLTNAARYTPEGGAIRVSAELDGSLAVLDVTDNGPGISADEQSRVFETFVQGARSAEGGLGLGLAIVKNLVALHGGEVLLHSELGRGSSFVIRLPLATAIAVEAAGLERAASDVVESRRVLVVDDNVDAADLLGEIVRMSGHDVQIAHDPERALAVMGDFQPEVALLDLGLPGMDGYELAALMRARLPRCQLIALTGYGQASDRARTRAAGFAEHMVKPVKIDVLMQLIERA